MPQVPATLRLLRRRCNVIPPAPTSDQGAPKPMTTVRATASRASSVASKPGFHAGTAPVKLDPAAWHAHMKMMVDNVSRVIDALKAKNAGAPVSGLHVTFDNEASGTKEFADAIKSGHKATYANRYAEAYAALDDKLNPPGA